MATELAATSIILVGGGIALVKVMESISGPNSPLQSLPGGSKSPVNHQPPDTSGTSLTSITGPVTPSNVQCPFFLPGTTIGNQVFLGANQRPNCSGFTFANYLYTQQGYTDPSNKSAVNDGLEYQVWRCLNQVTHIDDGWFYLSPNCGSGS